MNFTRSRVSDKTEDVANMNLSHAYFTATVARSKLLREVSYDDPSFRKIVGHANLLDTLQAALEDAEHRHEIYLKRSIQDFCQADERKQVFESEALVFAVDHCRDGDESDSDSDSVSSEIRDDDSSQGDINGSDTDDSASDDGGGEADDNDRSYSTCSFCCNPKERQNPLLGGVTVNCAEGWNKVCESIEQCGQEDEGDGVRYYNQRARRKTLETLLHDPLSPERASPMT